MVQGPDGDQPSIGGLASCFEIGSGWDEGWSLSPFRLVTTLRFDGGLLTRGQPLQRKTVICVGCYDYILVLRITTSITTIILLLV